MGGGGFKSKVGDIAYSLLPKPSVGYECGGPKLRTTNILVLGRLPNPTFTYYLEERLARLQNVSVVLKSLNDSLQGVDPKGTFVIVCRYIGKTQLDWMARSRDSLSGVALFIDDDLRSILVGEDASLLYKFNLGRLGVWPLRRLNPLLNQVWVSTDELATLLGESGNGITVVRPLPPRESFASSSSSGYAAERIKMVYHATGIHRREHNFLRPIVERALQQNPGLFFEVIADGKIASQWREIEALPDQLHVRNSVTWPEYLCQSSRASADIALVPLLRSRTNDCRSDTKRIDVVRLNAAGIFSRSIVFDRCKIEGELHVNNTAEEWLEAIDLLVRDHRVRKAAREANRLSLEKMIQSADPSFPF